MNRRLHGFTIAEMLIALLIISLVLSAAIPTITKKTAGSESIWQWSRSGASAYFGESATQTAIIGDTYLTGMSVDKLHSYLEHIEEFDDYGSVATNPLADMLTNTGDKLALIKQTGVVNSTYSDLANSHISFYTMNNSANATEENILYTGRLVLEKHNIGLGIGTLANMDQPDDSFQGKNTALGHYALMQNAHGSYNTAVGEMALAKNSFASNNTAVGFNAGLNLDRDSDQVYAEDLASNPSTRNANGNTAIGASALKFNLSGRYNTALGFNALNSNLSGDGNLALGTNACGNFLGNYSTCIGLNSGNALFDGTLKSQLPDLINDYKLENEGAANLLFVGTLPGGSNDLAPLLMGRMQSYSDSAGNLIKKRLSVNAKEFDVNTYNGGTNIFKITTNSGANGVDTTTADRKGSLVLNTFKNATKSIGLTLTSTDANKIQLNIPKGGDSTTPQGELWINQEALKIKAYDNSVKNAVDISTRYITTGVNKDKFIDFTLNDGQITLLSGGTTALRNYVPTATATNKHSAYINIVAPNGGIDVGSSDWQVSTSSTEKVFVFGDKKTTDDAGKSVFRVGKKGATTMTINLNGRVNIPGLSAIGTYPALDNGVEHNMSRLFSELSDKITAVSSASSDERLKNISGESTAGLKEINALEVKNFTYKEDKKKEPQVGVIAQQLMKVFPNSVFKDKKGYYRIKTNEIFYAMVNAIKELFVQFQDLTAKVVGLDARIEQLEKENAELKKQHEDFEKRLELLEAKM